MGATEWLARFVVEMGYKDFSPETVRHSKQLALKCLAGMLAGSVEPFGRKITKYVRELGGPPEVGIIGGGFKTKWL